jgi:hypothetical protein
VIDVLFFVLFGLVFENDILDWVRFAAITNIHFNNYFFVKREIYIVDDRQLQ